MDKFEEVRRIYKQVEDVYNNPDPRTDEVLEDLINQAYKEELYLLYHYIFHDSKARELWLLLLAESIEELQYFGMVPIDQVSEYIRGKMQEEDSGR